jgi:hypothetical protein
LLLGVPALVKTLKDRGVLKELTRKEVFVRAQSAAGPTPCALEKYREVRCLDCETTLTYECRRKKSMKSEKSEKITRFLLSFICFTAYIFLFVAVMANAYGTNLNHFLLG